MEKEKVSSGNIIDFRVLRRLMTFVRPYRVRFYILILLTVLLGVLTPLRPLLIQYTLDRDVVTGNYSGMVNVMLLILALLVVQSIFQYVFEDNLPFAQPFRSGGANIVLAKLFDNA